MNTIINEKRRYQRFETDCTVLYRGLDLFGAGRCPNVSLNGMQIACNENIPINSVITIELVSALMRPNPIKITGKVIWSRKNADDKLNMIGVGFICNFTQGTKFLSETFALKNSTKEPC